MTLVDKCHADCVISCSAAAANTAENHGVYGSAGELDKRECGGCTYLLITSTRALVRVLGGVLLALLDGCVSPGSPATERRGTERGRKTDALLSQAPTDEILLIAAQGTPRTSTLCSPLLSHVCIGLNGSQSDTNLSIYFLPCVAASGRIPQVSPCRGEGARDLARVKLLVITQARRSSW